MEDVLSFTDSSIKSESKFYDDAKHYWSQVPPTVDGMLGGFGCISNTDIRGSEAFIKKIFNLKNKPSQGRALDCGAGIGRITKNLLVKYFDAVDLVEQDSKFIEEGKHYLSLEQNVGEFYNCGLQDFIPKQNSYDVIWCQWVLGHLTDEHLINFLIRCKQGLNKNGLILIKENIASNGLVVDEEDSSMTRPLEHLLDLFEKADLHILRHCKQANFPRQLFSVKMFALKPKLSKSSTASIQQSENSVVSATNADMTSDIIQQLSKVAVADMK